ncbi:RING zinc finger-containing protein [Reticulomyxa filosa]|uniref:RING zinc finger-containing protein n=1 Tax=Reticulomyxa filosa TaxID=46433 RepID=X6PAR8_RETFI|nr:RING zinc finger-containing protein [Reticulomyxa filosa]|eukprot:ETO35635.1 RING zinc finger-containing protein [Reticulomyxa filosa]
MHHLIDNANISQDGDFWENKDNQFTRNGFMKIAIKLLCTENEQTYCVCMKNPCKNFRNEFKLTKQIRLDNNSKKVAYMKQFNDIDLGLIKDVKIQMENFLKNLESVDLIDQDQDQDQKQQQQQQNFQQIINMINVQEMHNKTTNKEIIKLLKKLQEDIIKKDTEIGELKTNVKELESKQEELNKSLTNANSTIVKMKKTIENLQNNGNNALNNDDLDSLNEISSIDSEKILFSDEKLKLASLQSQITDAVDKLKTRNLELGNKIEDLKTENTNMETIIGTIETVINTDNDIMAKVKKRNLDSAFNQDLDSAFNQDLDIDKPKKKKK